MVLGRVRPFCMENIPEGGLYAAQGTTELNPKADAVDAGGYYVQSPTGPVGGDTSVLYGRTGSVAQVTDTSGSLTMAQTVSVSGSSGGTIHGSLRDSAHFLGGGGPGEAFASGAVQTTTYVSGTPLVASTTWYASSAASAPPVASETYTYSGSSPLPGSAVYKTYDASGNVLTSITDTFSYTGPVLTGVTRTH